MIVWSPKAFGRELLRSLSNTNNFQIILLSVTIHSVVSIILIYLHLGWFFEYEIRYDYFETLKILFPIDKQMTVSTHSLLAIWNKTRYEVELTMDAFDNGWWSKTYHVLINRLIEHLFFLSLFVMMLYLQCESRLGRVSECPLPTVTTILRI